MMTNGTSKVFGVMGCPVGHSISPMMHNFFAEQTETDMIYVAFPVQPEGLRDAVRGAYALGIQGINVTVPHKQAVMDCLCGVDEGARVIGAVNTLVRTEQGYQGYNTDAEGLFRALQEEGMEIAGKTCILLGAGGAAKAAAYVLAREQAACVYILNRSEERGRKLAQEMNGLFGREIFQALGLADWGEIHENHCLAVQTTSVGMHPNEEGILIEAPAFYEKLDMAFDAIYTPEETRFLAMAKAAGAKTANGLGMLIYQGVAAYELWHPDKKLSAEVIAGARELLLHHLEGRE